MDYLNKPDPQTFIAHHVASKARSGAFAVSRMRTVA